MHRLAKRGGWPYSNSVNVPFMINRQSPQARGLVAWWPLGAGQYGMVRDVLGRFHVAAANSPQLVGSEQGRCTLFDDASSQWLAVSSAPVTGSPLTVTAWFRSDDFSATHCIFSMSNGDNFNYYHMILNTTPLLQVRVRDSGDATAAVTTTAGPSLGTWHMATFVEVSSADRRIYLDGGNKGTNTTDRSPSISTTTIGAAYQTELVWPFSGMVRDVRVYNRALFDAEIWASYVNPWELYQPVIPMVYGKAAVETEAIRSRILVPHYRPDPIHQLRI